MTALDKMVLALCAWKENRHGGQDGMQSVMNVIITRAYHQTKSIYAVIYEYLQFTSMSYHRDLQYLLQPEETDSMWILAKTLALEASNGNLKDITNGATNYYALTILEPDWAKKMTETAIIANQRFLK